MKFKQLLNIGAMGNRGAAPAVTYLLRDHFTTDQASPITLPRTCEPGPGTLTLDGGDATSLSISGGNLNFNAGSALTTLTLPTAGNIGDAFKMTGIVDLAGNNIGCMARFEKGYLLTSPKSGLLYQPTRGYGVVGVVKPQTLACIRVATGRVMALALIGGVWTVVDFNGNGTGQYIFGQYADNTASLFSADYVAVFNVPGVTDNSLAVSATPAPVSGTTGTMVNPGCTEFTWTPTASEVLELNVRMVDADNRWIIRCDQAGSTTKIIERTGGIETERASAAYTWTAAEPKLIEVWCEGNAISIFIAASTAPSYTSSVRNTATLTSVTGFATGDNFRSWPSTLSDPVAALLTNA